MLEYSFYSDNVYQFVVTNLKTPHSQKDPKIRNTIIEIVKNFFTLNNNPIVYYCDTSDNRQRQRDRLFKRWIESAQEIDGILTLEGKIRDEEGKENYITLISRGDNPNFEAIVSEFKNLIVTFKDKPQ
ncbi:MAG: DUF6169 family protein [Rikenellaceae bacterium]|nr:DUF6169 family protein [Rikenellaceae bacterium]